MTTPRAPRSAVSIASSSAALLAQLLALATLPAHAQQVTVDEGTFTLTVDGRRAGTEEFTIRRSGMGGDATVLAYGVVTVEGANGTRILRPVVQTLPSEGAVSGYQLAVEGDDPAQVTLNLGGRRYVSVFRSERGEEEREFQVRPGTRILEEGVAHHHYFLRNAREGERIPVLEPHARRQTQLVAGPAREEELTLGASTVQARRVTFTEGERVRVVWFDRQGRVLRVEIPSDGYVAVREDLVG